jgi:hypothetical protein
VRGTVGLGGGAVAVSGAPQSTRLALLACYREGINAHLTAAIAAIVLLALAGGLTQSLLPGTLLGQDAGWVAAGAVFAATYLALAIGRIPG